MTTIASGARHEGDDHGVFHHPALARDNIYLPRESAGRYANLFLGLGAVGLAGTLIAGIMTNARHALAGYQIGAMFCLAVAIGSTFLTLIFHLTQAGWSATIRRQFENAVSLLPLCGALLLPVVAVELWKGGLLFGWINAPADDVLAQHKKPYLNTMFFVVRFVAYTAIWTYLARRIVGYSLKQDATGDKWLTNKARFTSSWGILVLALTTAFASFDFLMAVDFKFFSTMWGVYFFAGSVFTASAFMAILFAILTRAGKLKGAVTEEHFHDLGKLMFAFTVFWAYIAFSQYFLIWYGAIPEETSFMLARKTAGWNEISTLLAVGHFIILFFVLLWKHIRRSPKLLIVVGAWMILMQLLDLFWIIRPMVYATDTVDRVHLDRIWIDLLGIAGPVGLFMSFFVRRMFAGPLIPLRDPRLPEALNHKNYV